MSATTTPEAWDGFVDRLRESGRQLLESAETDRDRAEGIRFLTRLTSAAIDMFVHYGDARRPGFVRLMDDQRKFFGDNPDAFYDFAAIDGTHSYRITGHRGTSAYLACCLYGRDAEGRATIVANLSDRDITFDEDGNFALHLASEPPPPGHRGDWIRLAPDVDTAVIRQYFLRKSEERPATYSIECLDDIPADHLDSADAANRLLAAASFVETGAAFTAMAAQVLAQEPNTISIDSEASDVSAFYPTPDNKYLAGWFHLEPDQALVVTGRAPRARYWSLLLMSRWMESLDAHHPSTALNSADIETDADGSFRLVISPVDPGVPNWLNTAGRSEGYFMFRWMQSEAPPRPELRVISLPELTWPRR